MEMGSIKKPFDPKDYSKRRDLPESIRKEFKTVLKSEGKKSGFVKKSAFKFDKERAEDEASRLVFRGKSPESLEEAESELALTNEIIEKLLKTPPTVKSESSSEISTPVIENKPEPSKLVEVKKPVVEKAIKPEDIFPDELKGIFQDIRDEATVVPPEFMGLRGIIEKGESAGDYLKGKGAEDIERDIDKLNNEFNRVNGLYVRLDQEIGQIDSPEVKKLRANMSSFLGKITNIKKFFKKRLLEKSNKKAPSKPPAETPPLSPAPEAPPPAPEAEKGPYGMYDRRLRRVRFTDVESIGRVEDAKRRTDGLFEKIRAKLIDKIKYVWNDWRFGAHEEVSKDLAEQLGLYQEELRDLESQFKEVDAEMQGELKNVDGIRSADYMDMKRDRDGLERYISRVKRNMEKISKKLDFRNRKKSSFESNIKLIAGEVADRIKQRTDPLEERMKGLEIEKDGFQKMIDSRRSELNKEREAVGEIIKQRDISTRKGSRRILNRRIARMEAKIREGDAAVRNCERQKARIQKPLDKINNEVRYWSGLSNEFETHEVEIYNPGAIERINPDTSIAWISATPIVERGYQWKEKTPEDLDDEEIEKMLGEWEEAAKRLLPEDRREVLSGIARVLGMLVPQSKMDQKKFEKLLNEYLAEKINNGEFVSIDQIESDLREGMGKSMLEKYFGY